MIKTSGKESLEKLETHIFDGYVNNAYCRM